MRFRAGSARIARAALVTLVQTMREEVDLQGRTTDLVSSKVKRMDTTETQTHEVLLEVDETGEATVAEAVEEAAGALLGLGTTVGSTEAVELAFDAEEETTLDDATVGATAARASLVGVTVEENL